MLKKEAARSTFLGLALALSIGLLSGYGASLFAQAPEATPTTFEVPASDSTATESSTQLVPVGYAGMQIFIDQETGRMRPPTPEEAKQLAVSMRQMFSKSVRRYVPKNLGDGTTAVVLGMDSLNFTMAHAESDGSVKLHCTDSVEGAIRTIEHAATVQTAAPREEQ